MTRPKQHEDSGLPLPANLDLALLADEVLYGLTTLSAHPAGLPVPGPLDLDMEYRVRLGRSKKVDVVLRGPKALAEAFSKASTFTNLALPLSPQEAFSDFARIYGLRLAGRFFQGEDFHFLSAPEPSHPRQWPARDPDSSCVVFVEDYPLEIRFWQEAG
jgi:hypothetical protein